MWFIFLQLRGLGISETANRYGLASMEEAEDYLQHALLGTRLVEICEALLEIGSHDAYAVFGSPDELKLRSCMTIFARVPEAPPAFKGVLKHFFNREEDPNTLRLLRM